MHQKDFDAIELVINKDGEMKEFEGEIDEVVLACAATASPLQLMRSRKLDVYGITFATGQAC